MVNTSDFLSGGMGSNPIRRTEVNKNSVEVLLVTFVTVTHEIAGSTPVYTAKIKRDCGNNWYSARLKPVSYRFESDWSH